jgi:hypothetical protein
MAVSLKLVFDGDDGKKVSLTYPYANASASGGQVKTLMQRIVTNGDIYASTPVALSKAEFVVNSVTPINIG